MDGLFTWLKDHTYALIVALILIVSNYSITGYRLDEIEKKVSYLEIDIESIRQDVLQIQLERAEDMSEIKTLLKELAANDKEFKAYIIKQEQNIRDFYEKYDLTPRNN